MPLINLPALTFITGEAGVGKTVLGNLLSDSVSNLISHSFDWPLYQATSGLFFDCSPSAIMTTEQVIPYADISGRNPTVKDSINALRPVFKLWMGSDILARMAVHFVRENVDYFERYTFDDADANHQDEVLALTKEFGLDNCLCLRVIRDPTAIPSILPCFDGMAQETILNVDTPHDMLNQFAGRGKPL